MRLSLMKLAYISIVLPLSMMLIACSSAKSTTGSNLVWQVEVLKFEVKDKLESVETVKRYAGSSQQLHQQFPAKGNVFLILNLSIGKQGADPSPFEWSKLTVQDKAGNSYQRSGDDTYLEMYKYSPRLTALEITSGAYKGWICYEIPAQAANDKLTLTYSAQGSQQEITVK
jgi:hypothetical protein